jgi:hypothetical protein
VAFLHAPGSLPPKSLFPRTEDIRASPGGVRPISSSSRNRGRQGSLYHPVGKAKLITQPIATTPRLYRPAREEIVARVAPNWRSPRLLISSCPGTNIVFYAKFPILTLSSCSGKDIVLVRKRCRPTRERISSPPGTNIVPSGNLYRFIGEKLPSCLGNTRSFPLQTCPFFCA